MTRALSAIIALVALLVSASLGYASFRMHGLGPAAPVISNISSGTPGTTTDDHLDNLDLLNLRRQLRPHLRLRIDRQLPLARRHLALDST